jgi:hypothetical protein
MVRAARILIHMDSMNLALHVDNSSARKVTPAAMQHNNERRFVSQYIASAKTPEITFV